MTDSLEEVVKGWAEIVDEPVQWVKAKNPHYLNFSLPSTTPPWTGDTKYLKLERNLAGKDWIEAASAREEGYLRLDLAEQSAVEFVSSVSYPPLDRSPAKNWVEKAGGLPKYIERIAKHLVYEAGRTVGVAIAIAVNAVKKTCATGDTNLPGAQQVNAKARAEACKAVAEWEKKKASGKNK